MRCAACDHRWLIDAASPDLSPEPAPPSPIAVAPLPLQPDPAPDWRPNSDLLPDKPSRSSLLRTRAAVAIGGALAIAAAGLWLKRVDPAGLPLIGDRLAMLSSPALPLAVAFTARTTVLPSGERLLDINGRVTNTGAVPIDLPPLEARLAGPGGTLRRWRISVPAARLGPGKAAGFASTATGFPADATIVAIRPGR